jgi:DNA polymerase (family X)
MSDLERASAILHEFMTSYQALGDPRAYAYANVINEMRTHATLDEFLAKDRPGVGPKMRAKLLQIQAHKPLPKLTKLRKQAASLAQLQTILGVGTETSREWARMGAHDVKSVRGLIKSGKIVPTHMQSIGVKYYDDLRTRIPRKEVNEIAKYVAKCIDLSQHEVVGSYRRMLKTSGDIDIIVCGDNNKNPPKGAIMLTNGLDRVSFLIKWHMWRQVDILYCTEREYPFALLYFTGSYEFNIAMRAWAQKLGFTLNQKELSGWDGVAATERDIFDALGIQYVEPQDRKDGSSLHPVVKMGMADPIRVGHTTCEQ